MPTDTWNPAQYNLFQREREQPFFDLLAGVVPRPDMRVVDLGCGTGRLTRLLHQRLHARETVGIDQSARMLEGSADAALPGLRFEAGTIESFPDGRGRFDVIFSNAALHWVADHEILISRLAEALTASGQLAFQVPAMHDNPSHMLATELASEEPYAGALAGWHRPLHVLSPDAYARLLFRLGFADPKVELIVYPHVLADADAVVEWMKGTLLTDYARRLPDDLFAMFLAAYRRRLVEQLGSQTPFFFPFKRILCWGHRA
ncbi:MAG TPA: methyltransferase domain-containing protein [Vicinamibacterales bacterium]|jgi:trans-aconitate 2-methyltransferase